jgi:RNA polymerase primary sigma factor
LSQDIQEKHDHVRNLIALGKERGYLLTEEVNDFLAAEEHTPEEIDTVLSSFENDGIEVYEDASAAKVARGLPEVAESTEPATGASCGCIPISGITATPSAGC